MLPGTYDSGFGISLMVKDMRIVVDLAHELGVASPLAERAGALWEEALAALPDTADCTEIAHWLQGVVNGVAGPPPAPPESGPAAPERAGMTLSGMISARTAG